MIKSSHIIILLVSLLMSPSWAQSATLYVPEAYRTIQEAVQAAMPYDEVIVNPGIYKENVEIGKPLILRSSQGAESTIIQAAAQDRPVIKIANTTNVSVVGISATGSAMAGVLVNDASGLVISNNSFTNNGTGILAYGLAGSTVTGNTSNSNTQYGMYMERSHGNRIERNTANLNKDKGFFISGSNDNEIVNNNVNLNTWDGIMVYSSKGNTVTGNRTLRNTYGMVISESDGNDISDNTTIPNLFLILPIFLIYLGIVSYLIQKNILRLVYKG